MKKGPVIPQPKSRNWKPAGVITGKAESKTLAAMLAIGVAAFFFGITAMWIVQPLQLAKDNQPSGKWRLTCVSDEDSSGHVRPCCQHEHDSPEEASQCIEARRQADRITGMGATALRVRYPQEMAPAEVENWTSVWLKVADGWHHYAMFSDVVDADAEVARISHELATAIALPFKVYPTTLGIISGLANHRAGPVILGIQRCIDCGAVIGVDAWHTRLVKHIYTDGLPAMVPVGSVVHRKDRRNLLGQNADLPNCWEL